MKVMHESAEYREYFDEVQGYYSGEEKKEEIGPIGKRIKDLREMQRLSSEQFAKMAGIDEEKLKKIESQTILPDLGTVVKLSKALRIGTGFLLGEESGYSYSVVRRDDRKKIARHATGASDRPNYIYQSLASGIKDKHMEAFLITLAAGEGNAELSSHDGEEFIVVMEGSIRVILGKKEETLSEGDSIYYLSRIPHNVQTASRTQNAVIMAVLYAG